MNAKSDIAVNPENIMDHLGQKVIIDGVTYDLPSAEELSCADLREGWSISRKVREQLAEGDC